jgi:hypothetical protein
MKRVFLDAEPLQCSVVRTGGGIAGDGDEVKFRCPGCEKLLSIRRSAALEPADPRRKFCPKCEVTWALDLFSDGTGLISGWIGGPPNFTVLARTLAEQLR